MRTQREIENATLDSHLQTASMGMELNATSFNHILNNLYKNPLGAVLRELTTNAIESHVLAKTNKRVAIQLPTSLSQELIIRDFGTGLTHTDVMKYLNTLFSSSKSSDNESRGGFGLGCKSPLALVDTFLLTSICEGKKNVYAWIKEGGKLPSLVRMGDEEDYDEPTKEHDGITINIPLGSSSKLDISNLTNICNKEARRQLFGFTKDLIMIVENALVDSYEDLEDITDEVLTEVRLLSLPNIDIFKRSSQSPNKTNDRALMEMYISVGDVVYPCVSSSEYSTHLRAVTNLFKNSNNYAFVFKAPIGSLDIPMSREEILDTVANKNLIKKIMTDACVDVKDHIKSLNINLDCDLITFYNQFKTFNTTNTTPDQIQFALDLDQNAFEKNESLLVNEFKQLYTKQNPHSSSRYGTLQYSDLKRGSLVDNILNRTLSRIEGLDAIKVFKYDSLFTVRSRIKDSYYSSSEIRVDDTAYSFIITPLPLSGGVTNVDIERYIQQVLKPKNTVIVLQTREEVVKAVKRLVDINNTWQKIFSSAKEESEVFEVLDPIAVKDFKAKWKASLKTNTNATTRSTFDFIPGFRISNLTCNEHYYTTPTQGIQFIENDSKIFKLLDSDGKTVQPSPAYLTPAQLANKVVITSGSVLPLDVSSFLVIDPVTGVVTTTTFQPNCILIKKQLDGVTVVTVQERSLENTIARFNADKTLDVYTKDRPLPLVKDTFQTLSVATQEQLSKNAFNQWLEKTIINYYSATGNTSVARDCQRVILQTLTKVFEKTKRDEVSEIVYNYLKTATTFSSFRDVTAATPLTFKLDTAPLDLHWNSLYPLFVQELSKDPLLKSKLISIIQEDIFKRSLLNEYLANIIKP